MTSRVRLAALTSCLLLAGLTHAAGADDWAAVDKILGQTGKSLSGDVHRYAWPRRDLHVTVRGTPVEPALALGSWAGFLPGEHGMAMGDLVLLSSEVNPVIRALQKGGLEVLAVHNHLIGETPQILYVHFAGHGSPEVLARALAGALAATRTPIGASAAKPAEPSAAERAAFDSLQASLGRKGSFAGRVLQVGVPRASRIEEGGVEMPPSLGLGIGMNFEVVGSNVAATGDFVLLADEVNPVIGALQSHGIEVTALHSHMLRESPRLFFMHFWVVDHPAKVGEGLKAALAKVAVQ